MGYIDTTVSAAWLRVILPGAAGVWAAGDVFNGSASYLTGWAWPLTLTI